MRELLQARFDIIKKIKSFFFNREVLEVETPLLSNHTVTDPFIPSLYTQSRFNNTKKYFLQTSPEYAMKRLLAQGSGDIFQLTKSFRDDEPGRHHNPEFSLLEWYRIGFDHHDLMAEMNELLRILFDTQDSDKISYKNLFLKYINIDPFTINLEFILDLLKQKNIYLNNNIDIDTGLNLLLSHLIEPNLGLDKPIMIYDFPKSQAALSKIRKDPKTGIEYGERFEVYYKGLELANGFHELTNPTEQKNRFIENNKFRQEHNLPIIPIDPNFISALASGLPDCAGVALGVDRLIMLALNKSHIDQVLSFPIDHA